MRRTIGMIGVERVPRAAVVGVARAVVFENVVGAVVQARGSSSVGPLWSPSAV